MLALIFAGAANATTFIVSNGGDAGTGSLRQAILDAEGNGNDPTVDQITFTYTGAITLEATLPDITTPLTIAGPGVSNLHVQRDPVAATQFRILSVDPDTGFTVTIQDLTISGGRAQNSTGAGIAKAGDGTLILDKVVLSDNEASVNGSGGAVSVDQGFASIRNSTLTDNEASFGGAIIVDQASMSQIGSAEIVNSTISGNRAREFGGAIYTNVGHIQIQSSTIHDNTADSDDAGGGSGGGTYNGGGDATAFNVANTLYAGNQVGSSSPTANQCGGGHTSFGYNLRETSEIDCTGFIQTGDTVDSSASMLGTLGSNGGPTPTIALQVGNFAIDHGNPATPADNAFPACPATDQRGFLRGGTADTCDIGAFELGATEPPPPPPPGGTTPPPVTTAAGPTGLRAAAIKKCKKKFRKGPRRKKCIKHAKRLPV